MEKCVCCGNERPSVIKRPEYDNDLLCHPCTVYISSYKNNPNPFYGDGNGGIAIRYLKNKNIAYAHKERVFSEIKEIISVHIKKGIHKYPIGSLMVYIQDEYNDELIQFEKMRSFIIFDQHTSDNYLNLWAIYNESIIDFINTVYKDIQNDPTNPFYKEI